METKFITIDIQHQHSGNVHWIDHLKSLFNFVVHARLGKSGADACLIVFGFGVNVSVEWGMPSVGLTLYGLDTETEFFTGRVSDWSHPWLFEEAQDEPSVY